MMFHHFTNFDEETIFLFQPVNETYFQTLLNGFTLFDAFVF